MSSKALKQSKSNVKPESTVTPIAEHEQISQQPKLGEDELHKESAAPTMPGNSCSDNRYFLSPSTPRSANLSSSWTSDKTDGGKLHNGGLISQYTHRISPHCCSGGGDMEGSNGDNSLKDHQRRYPAMIETVCFAIRCVRACADSVRAIPSSISVPSS